MPYFRIFLLLLIEFYAYFTLCIIGIGIIIKLPSTFVYRKIILVFVRHLIWAFFFFLKLCQCDIIVFNWNKIKLLLIFLWLSKFYFFWFRLLKEIKLEFRRFIQVIWILIIRMKVLRSLISSVLFYFNFSVSFFSKALFYMI